MFGALLCRIACSDRTVITARHVLPHLRRAMEREVKAMGVGRRRGMGGACDALALGVAASVDGIECCFCKRLCH